MMLEAISPLGNVFGKDIPVANVAGVQVSERSDIGAVLCTITLPQKNTVKALGKALGCSLPATHGPTNEAKGKRAIWLNPTSWIVLCAHGEEAKMIAAVTKAFPDRSAYATHFSDALGWLKLEGDAIEDLLRQGSFVTFEPTGLGVEHAKRTPVAGIPAVILRESEKTWMIGVERSRTSYFTDWLTGLSQTYSGDRT